MSLHNPRVADGHVFVAQALQYRLLFVYMGQRLREIIYLASRIRIYLSGFVEKIIEGLQNTRLLDTNTSNQLIVDFYLKIFPKPLSDEDIK